jgi:hypothetical protein
VPDQLDFAILRSRSAAALNVHPRTPRAAASLGPRLARNLARHSAGTRVVSPRLVGDALAEHVLRELFEDLHVLAGRREPESHRVHAEVSDPAQSPPRRHLLGSLFGRNIGEGEASFDPELGGIPPRRPDLTVEPVHDGLRLEAGAEVRHPSVRDPRGPVEDDFALAPQSTRGWNAGRARD